MIKANFARERRFRTSKCHVTNFILSMPWEVVANKKTQRTVLHTSISNMAFRQGQGQGTSQSQSQSQAQGRAQGHGSTGTTSSQRNVNAIEHPRPQLMPSTTQQNNHPQALSNNNNPPMTQEQQEQWVKARQIHQQQLLTEHFGSSPLSFVDDVINSVNNMIYQASMALQEFIEFQLQEIAQIEGRTLDIKLETEKVWATLFVLFRVTKTNGLFSLVWGLRSDIFCFSHTISSRECTSSKPCSSPQSIGISTASSCTR